MMERLVARPAGGCILTNCNVWSSDSCWIVYDTRSDAAGSLFDSSHIERVHATTGEVRSVYDSRNGACCGVATWHPNAMKIVFILGPENPSSAWCYGPSRRQGVFVDVDKPGIAHNIDARDLTPPFTPGALRGGSHVHVFHPEGDWLSFTYDDDLVGGGRNIAVSVPAGVVKASRGHPRNHDGGYFTVLATQTVEKPKPGSEEISRACEEAWIGSTKSLAFQGSVVTKDGGTISEVFIVGLPEDVRQVGDGPLQGTATKRPYPPRGTTQRRITDTSDRTHPGLQGPRHWLRSSPDGDQIGCLMKDDAGVVQFWTVQARGGMKQITRAGLGVDSAFTWSPCGTFVVALVDGCISRIELKQGAVKALSAPSKLGDAIRPEACVISPNGKKIAFIRHRNGKNCLCVTSSE